MSLTSQIYFWPFYVYIIYIFTPLMYRFYKISLYNIHFSLWLYSVDFLASIYDVGNNIYRVSMG